MQNKDKEMTAAKPHYKWPWFVLVGLLLAIGLAIVWMSGEVARTRRIRELNRPTPTASDNSEPAPAHSNDNSWTNDMVWIPGGKFWMGSEDGQPDEKPV